MNVVGIENVDYVSKKTGKRVYGKTLHMSEALPEEKGVGVKVQSVYCREDIARDVIIGDTVQFYYDEFKNVNFIKVI